MLEISEIFFCLLYRWDSDRSHGSAFYTPPSSMQKSSASELSQWGRVPGSGTSASSGIGGLHPNSSISSADSYSHMERYMFFSIYQILKNIGIGSRIVFPSVCLRIEIARKNEW